MIILDGKKYRDELLEKYKDKIENLLENSDKIEVEFPNINDDFFELEKAYTKEVEV